MDDDNICAELVALAVKAGRRASYDLIHACDLIDDPEQREFFRQRAQTWLNIFAFDNGMKDYRHRLHHEISRLEIKVQHLQQLLQENGIEDSDAIPF